MMFGWRGVVVSPLPFVAGACSFPDVAFVADDAQPAAEASTGAEVEPMVVDSGDAPDPQGIPATVEGGAVQEGPGPSTIHDAGAKDAGRRNDGGVDCLCDASQMYPANIDCSAVKLANLGLLCSQASGFVGSDPGCGNSGVFVTCTAGLALACAAGTMSVVTQQCH